MKKDSCINAVSVTVLFYGKLRCRQNNDKNVLEMDFLGQRVGDCVIVKTISKETVAGFFNIWKYMMTCI